MVLFFSFKLSLYMLASSVLTLLVPLASRTSFTLTLIARAATGLSQAATFPSCFYFYARYIMHAPAQHFY